MAENEIVVEILDSGWNRKALSRELHSAEVTEELGDVGGATVTIAKDDPVIGYLPDPDASSPYEGRFRLYEDGNEVFAGVIDSLSYHLDSEGNHSFEGKGRGIEMSFYNFGRRDINGWPVRDIFQELLRDNIGKAPLASIQRSVNALASHPALNAITGDPYAGQYYSAKATGSNSFDIDLGSQQVIDAIRVIPPWWDGRWYKFRVYYSTDDSSYSQIYDKSNVYPSTDRGFLLTASLPVTARYIRITIYDSSDSTARMASVLVLQNKAAIGGGTTYTVPFIENDDSGNITLAGSTSRVIVNGAFNGDGVTGNSFCTKLASGGSMTHAFRGISTSVYMTQADQGTASVKIYLDTVLQGTYTAPNNSFQYKVFEVTGLTAGAHTLKVEYFSGTPLVDYFTGQYESSWRYIREDDPSIGRASAWTQVDNTLEQVQAGNDDYNFSVLRSSVNGAMLFYEFYGNKINFIGTKGPTHSTSVQVYLDDVLDATLDLSGAEAHKQVLYTWSGAYGRHTLRIRNNVTGLLVLDRLEGNFSHTIYMRSAYDHNLALLNRLSEITNGYMRYNFDGSIDLLGIAGTEVPQLLREGENEGGQIIQATVTDEYTETYSAALGLVNGPGDVPIKAFVIDREAVKVMGLKVGKFENSDSIDAFLLTRQTWQWLQDHKIANPSYDITYLSDDSVDEAQVKVGNSIRLYAPTVNLSGEYKRLGIKKTTWSSE